jgi:hypothetical protein
MAAAQKATQPAAAATSVGAADPSKKTNSVPASNAPFQIQPLRRGEDRWLKAVFYARHGIGKTVLGGSAVDVPEMRDVLFISAERGQMSLEESPRIKNPELIDIIQVESFKTIARIHDYLIGHCKFRDENNDTKLMAAQKALGLPDDRVRKYKTVVLDTLSEAETYSTYNVLNIDITKPIDEEIDIAGWPEFRKNFESVKLLARAFRNLPMHVILLCQEQYRQDEMKRFHYSPKMTGQLATDIQGFVDVVGRLVSGAPTDDKPAPRRVYFQPIANGPVFDAKNRKGNAETPFLDDPTMTDIARLMGITK